jgi:hypothetical protein
MYEDYTAFAIGSGLLPVWPQFYGLFYGCRHINHGALTRFKVGAARVAILCLDFRVRW